MYLYIVLFVTTGEYIGAHSWMLTEIYIFFSLRLLSKKETSICNAYVEILYTNKIEDNFSFLFSAALILCSENCE
jgi:hypothetical protein